MRIVNAMFLAAVGGLALSEPCLAQNQAHPASASGEARAPGLIPLPAGALQIAADADLTIEKIEIGVTASQVSTSYFLANKGHNELGLAASVAMPVLQTGPDGTALWALASEDFENPIGLSIASDGKPVHPTIDAKAIAVGIDRLAEIKAAGLPPIPFGAATDKALANLPEEGARALAALGILSPKNPDDPGHKPVADWTLQVTHGWRQALPPGKTTVLVTKYAPLKATMTYHPDDALDLEDLKDEGCLTPQTIAALQNKLKGARSEIAATEIALVNDPPAHWIDSPTAAISVTKPSGSAIVAFCGIDPKTADQPIVRGSEIGGDDPRDFRILIFEPNHP
jgi:Domain of unknown function (DUF4424)